MDQEVSLLKFQREAEQIELLASDFGWTLTCKEHPVLELIVAHPTSGRRVGLRFGCDGWDGQPPAFTLIDPETRNELPWDKWPQGWPAGNGHPVTGKPFLCLPGLREYHTHPSHLGEKWETFRSAGKHRLIDIVIRVKQRFGDSHG